MSDILIPGHVAAAGHIPSRAPTIMEVIATVEAQISSMTNEQCVEYMLDRMTDEMILKLRVMGIEVEYPLAAAPTPPAGVIIP